MGKIYESAERTLIWLGALPRRLIVFMEVVGGIFDGLMSLSSFFKICPSRECGISRLGESLDAMDKYILAHPEEGIIQCEQFLFSTLRLMLSESYLGKSLDSAGDTLSAAPAIIFDGYPLLHLVPLGAFSFIISQLDIDRNILRQSRVRLVHEFMSWNLQDLPSLYGSRTARSRQKLPLSTVVGRWVDGGCKDRRDRI
ncbi:hypothetical protein BU23DRAFT_637599 [Bimuria novae-zelandiae CBS 107.79]|uniref:Uncharacterized protein n=1 Tax=Bimuria novae-zelandiae CBS 107.79 TaxID=1447943 RepID=A0A6A5VT80_9PLEO|nr:hypothetical protein BU23DRAFT_637599 [Bimuria novae-zelandiae CBS 107.79]